MGDDIGLGLLSMAVCFDFHSTNIVQLSNRNPYFYQFRCHHPLITQLRLKTHIELWGCTNRHSSQRYLGIYNDFVRDSRWRQEGTGGFWLRDFRISHYGLVRKRKKTGKILDQVPLLIRFFFISYFFSWSTVVKVEEAAFLERKDSIEWVIDVSFIPLIFFHSLN